MNDPDATGLAGLASARMTDDQRRTLLVRLDELDGAATADALLEADIAFHACIAAGAGNVVLASLLDTFRRARIAARHLNAGLGLEEALVRSRASHRRIYEAIVARDAHHCRHAMA